MRNVRMRIGSNKEPLLGMGGPEGSGPSATAAAGSGGAGPREDDGAAPSSPVPGRKPRKICIAYSRFDVGTHLMEKAKQVRRLGRLHGWAGSGGGRAAGGTVGRAGRLAGSWAHGQLVGAPSRSTGTCPLSVKLHGLDRAGLGWAGHHIVGELLGGLDSTQPDSAQPRSPPRQVMLEPEDTVYVAHSFEGKGVSEPLLAEGVCSSVLCGRTLPPLEAVRSARSTGTSLRSVTVIHV